jgi:LacI family transcriptional regulator, sucrose operon repressor
VVRPIPTIKDVAQRAGVTVTTVSRVLNNRGYISEQTRSKVAEAMKELDYVPNEMARSLLRQRSNIIGLIVPAVSHPFFSELAMHVEYYAYEMGYKILLCNSHLDIAKERKYIDMLKRHKVDGIIMGSHTLDVDEYQSLSMPIVTIDRKIDDAIPSVSSDNRQGGLLATRRLISRGCRKLAMIAGSLQLDLLANQRCTSFIAESEAQGIEHVIVQTNLDVFDYSQYGDLVDKLFLEHPDIDGVFTSDVKAAYVIQACARLGKSVPRDVKIVGYDDSQIASLLVPRLTTIRQPKEAMAKLALETVVKQIRGESFSLETVLPVELIDRDSA